MPLLGLALINYNKGDKVNAKKYLDQAKDLEPGLNNGIDGVKDLENMGYFKPDNIKDALIKLFKEKS